MSVTGVRLQQDLQGKPCMDMETPQPKKSIATTRTFEKNYTTFGALKERIVTFAVSCSEKLRQQQSCANTLSVFIVGNRHRPDLPQYSRSITLRLPYPSQSAIELAAFAGRALEKIYKAGYPYKKAGVIVSDFSPRQHLQQTLFESSNPKHEPLMHALDKLNTTYGQHTIKLGAQDVRRKWKMKQEKLSPRYTTQLSDIITIHCP